MVEQRMRLGQTMWQFRLYGKPNRRDCSDILKKIIIPYRIHIGEYSILKEKADKEFADSVLEVSIGANKQVIEELIGDGDMCQALMEIMEPQLLLREMKGKKEGIQGTVDTLREFGHGDMEIKNAIMQRYGLSKEEAEEYLWGKSRKFWVVDFLLLLGKDLAALKNFEVAYRLLNVCYFFEKNGQE